MITVTFISNGMKSVTAPESSNLLRLSLREKGGIPFKCGGGLCGTCKCRIEVGLEHTDAIKPKERKHLSEAEIANGYRMACQTFVNGDIQVSWEQPASRSAAGGQQRQETAQNGSSPEARRGDDRSARPSIAAAEWTGWRRIQENEA